MANSSLFYHYSKKLYIFIYKYKTTNIYMYVCMCICMYVYMCNFGYMDTYNIRPENLSIYGLVWTGHTCKEKKSQKSKDSFQILLIIPTSLS